MVNETEQNGEVVMEAGREETAKKPGIFKRFLAWVDTPIDVDKSDEVKRPGIVKQIIPWLVTIGVFYWVFRRVDFHQVWLQMKLANLWILVPAMAALVVVQITLDIFSFGTSYKWFCENFPGYKQIAVGRIAPYIIQVLWAPLMGVILTLYFIKVCRMRLVKIIAADTYTLHFESVHQTIGLAVALILVTVTGADPIHWGFYVWCAVNLLFFLFWYIYWMTGVKDRLFRRLRDFSLLHPWKVAGWSKVIRMFFIRLPWFFATLGSMYVCLLAFKIQIPFITFLIAAPIIMAMAFSPISVGGYGAPQGLAILFFSKYASVEIIVAQSLLWSTFFALFRIVLSTPFIIPMIRNFQNPPHLEPVVTNAPVLDESE